MSHKLKHLLIALLFFYVSEIILVDVKTMMTSAAFSGVLALLVVCVLCILYCALRWVFLKWNIWFWFLDIFFHYSEHSFVGRMIRRSDERNQIKQTKINYPTVAGNSCIHTLYGQRWWRMFTDIILIVKETNRFSS